MKEEEFLQPHIGKLVQQVLKKIGMKNIVFGQRMNLKSSGETQKYIGEISHTRLQFLKTDLPKFGQ